MSIHSFPEHPILLVDDEPRALRVFTMILEFNGINNVHPCQDESRVMGMLVRGRHGSCSVGYDHADKIGGEPAR